jgi:serine O-acetyltransferase
MTASAGTTEKPEVLQEKTRAPTDTLLKALQRDCVGYRHLGRWWAHPGFWIGVIYRLGAWLHSVRNPLVRLPLQACYWLIKQPYRFLLHVEIPSRARIGAGLCLPHPYNIIISDGAELGENCVIYHEVTIGRGPLAGHVKAGNNVVLFPGVRILGGVVIGDRSEIGANCVVMKSVPEDSLVMHPPIRPVPMTLVRKS